MTILVVGDANADLSAQIAHFPQEGDDTLVHALSWGSGGSATNTAVALARLGVPTRLMARVGNDPIAELALRAATAAGVDLSEIQTDTHLATGLCYAAISPNGERSFFSFRGANATLSLTDTDRPLRGCDWLHVGGHALIEGIQRATVVELIAAAVQYQIPVSIDVCLPLIRTQREHLLHLLRDVTILFANEIEVGMLATGEFHSTAEARSIPQYAATIRILTGMRGVIVAKCGAQGCVVDHGVVIQIPGYRVAVADTNGCGDAFVAGFLAAYLAGHRVEEAGRYGNISGALAASRPGAAESLPYRAEVDEFADKG